MNDVLLYDVTQVESDFYLQTHSTNPLLSTETITRAIHLFLDNYPSYDSLFSVTRIQTRLWDSMGRAINHNPAILLRTQDLQPVYEENLRKLRGELGCEVVAVSAVTGRGLEGLTERIWRTLQEEKAAE